MYTLFMKFVSGMSKICYEMTTHVLAVDKTVDKTKHY